MAARPRMRSRAKWPDGLREPRPGYYTWVDPRDGKSHTLGRVPLAQAIYEATEANIVVARGRLVRTLAERVTTGEHTVAELLAKLPVSPKPGSRKNQKYLDGIITRYVGSVACAELTTKHCADMLEELKDQGKNATAKVLRGRLIRAGKRGMSLGWMTTNPAAMTEQPALQVKRRRLSLDEFWRIFDKAPEVRGWLQNIMLLALVSGQDRSTCVQWERNSVRDGFATVTRGKTGVVIEIPVDLRLDAIGMSLADVIARCKSSNIVSRYLVHHTKKSVRAAVGSPVAPGIVSEAFAAARVLAGVTGDDAPTFHEIRSLSKRLYVKQGGVDTKALLGHLTDSSAELYENSRGLEPIRVKLGS